MKLTRFFAIVIIVLCSNLLFAQTTALIKGKVISDSTQKTLGFASITLVGTKKGTTADVQGNFTLKLPDENKQYKILVGYTGYITKEILVKAGDNITIKLKEDFKEGFRDRKLAAAMRNKVVENVRITPNEVKAYYERTPKDSLPYYESEVEIGQIVIYPKPSRDAEEYAVEQLKEFKQQLETGKRDMKTLAALYSDDPGSKDKAGEYNINRNEKQWDPSFLAKAFSLKEGQVSAPFKSKFGYHIIQMVNRAGDDAVVRHILKIPQVTKTETKASLQKLDSVRAKLIAGTLTFGEAVNKYTEDESSKFTGGMQQSPEGGSYITLDQLDKDMVVMMKILSLGEFSQPTEFTDQRSKKGVRIVYLKSKSEPHRENVKDDFSKIAQRALEEKKNEALEKWFVEKIPTYYIKIDDDFKRCDEMQKWLHSAEATVKN